MQYQSECRNALESVVNISKSFQKAFMDVMKLFMGRVNEQVQHEVKLQQKSKELILRSRKFQFFPWPAVDLQLD